MLTKEQLPTVLTNLGFQQQGFVYSKHFHQDILAVDCQRGEIIYPEFAGLVVNERQTCNFEANENFVVFECVHRLLEKGYKPEHLELEPKWKLGHGASGGRADILVKNNDGRPLLIIECKTAGSEFARAWNKTLLDGDQLFSYAQQISETQFLCLYTVELEADAIVYTSHIIAHRDNDTYLADNPSLKRFKDAADVKERFAVWRDTYKLGFTTQGLFEEIIQPYHIGKDKYTLADLHVISDADRKKKYHEYATILRQHNVSGRENAFDKLVNLFLCKLVDESENKDDLKFYWKGVAYDTHFELVDRLQQLYQKGMDTFLGEKITYINHADVSNALYFIRLDPDATQRAVWNLFIQQKFFTNNDFSLIDVHNERLFYQNAEILLKILQMWQDIRLTNPDGQHQFLGDLFEGFLDQGIKQSEGQFFTPMPICRFILMSLPLASLLQQAATLPKALDYACGAGHFLTELAQQLEPLVRTHQPDADNTAYQKMIFGIEKEYRLSKVAKVSAFMYGQRDINICYGDALVKQHAAFPAIQDHSFQLLVANPPYSVRGFLTTLSESERNAYTLTKTINDFDTANSIETFFLERAQQLLAAGGVAAIILPSSILSNGSNTYIRAREILLQYFDLVAIVEFGSGTFGKTGTNTITLFLRRKKTAPDTAEHYRERVNNWFGGSEKDQERQRIYQDAHLLADYAAHIGVPLEDYHSLLDSANNGAWRNHAYFSAYADKFDNGTEMNNLRKAKWFKALAVTEQEVELQQRYLEMVREVERDKLYYFVMASDQSHPVLIIRSPTDTKVAKQFLGYDWSAAKGDEGIKLIKDAAGNHLTPLYDPKDRNNASKLNYLVTANFDGVLREIPASLQDVAHTAQLVDMLDFSRAGFEKTVSLQKEIALIQNKWALQKISSYFETIESGKRPTGGVGNILSGVLSLGGEHIHATKGTIDLSAPKYVPQNFFAAATKGIIQAGDILLCKDGALTGKVALLRDELVGQNAMVNEHLFILRTMDGIRQKYAFHFLCNHQGQQLLKRAITGAAQGGLNSSNLKEILIPVPDDETMQKIVAESETIDQQAAVAQSQIDEIKVMIDEHIKTTTEFCQRQPLSAIANLSRGASPRPIDAYLTTAEDGIPWIKIGDVAPGAKYIETTAQKITADGAKKSRMVRCGEFIISNSMSVGRPYILAIDGCVHDGWLIVAEIAPEIDSDFLYYALSSSDAQNQFKERALGGVVQNLNIDRAKTVTLPIPSLAEQQQLVATIAVLEKQIAEAQSIIDTAATRKQAVLEYYL